MKPLFQFKKPDKHSAVHLFGSCGLVVTVSMLGGSEWWAASYALSLGIAYEVGQWSAYKSEEIIDIVDLAFNFLGVVCGIIIVGGF